MKDKIASTRLIGFGSSDAKMLASVGRNGRLTKTAENRLAVLTSQKEISKFSTLSTRYGDFIEENIFNWLKSNPAFRGYEFTSNPYYEVPDIKYKFKCFNHIDIEAKKGNSIAWIECKAVNDDIDKTIKAYKEQNEWHNWILKTNYQKGYNIKLYLCHYHTKDKVSDFDPSRISLRLIEPCNKLFQRIVSGLEYVNSIIDDFEYKEPMNLEVTSLPTHLQKQLDEIYLFKKQEAIMKDKIKDFAEKMGVLMDSQKIDSIKTKTMSFTRVKDAEYKVFDKERFEKEHPRLYKKYLQSNKRSGYVKLNIK